MFLSYVVAFSKFVGILQMAASSSAEIETNMTAVERVTEFVKIDKEAPLVCCLVEILSSNPIRKALNSKLQIQWLTLWRWGQNKSVQSAGYEIDMRS